MLKKYVLISVFLMCAAAVTPQQQAKTAYKASLVAKAVYMKEIPSVAQQIKSGTLLTASDQIKEVNPKRTGNNLVVPGKGLPKGPDPLADFQKSANLYKTPGPSLVFEAASDGTTPTDPTGAVGTNHFVNAWNSEFRIWDKEGNPLTSEASLASIFPGESLGDPIVIFDHIADRFLITQFSGSPNGFLVAVCQGPDPVNDGWYTYRFNTGSFPDYPKFSLWSDGYYVTANKNSGSAGTSEVVYALERDEMLEGNPNAQFVGFPLPGIVTSGFYSPLGFNVNGTEMPPPGNAPIVYMQDDEWFGVSEDHLKIWSIDVDWADPVNSTISSPQELAVTPFDGLFDGGSFSNLPQPSGPDIDALQATIMYMAQYRRFDNYNTVVLNFVVDLDGSEDYAGIRWYELHQENHGDPWSIFQEGTYVQPDGHSAFAGNMAIDKDGNIAMAYSIVSQSQFPALRYTGRYANDPSGEMTLEENVIMDGTQSDPSFRYGDYSQMTIDPVDDATFWSIGEIFTQGTRKNYVGVFKLAPDLTDDLGVVEITNPVSGQLTDSEIVTVRVRNFGSTAKSNFPVSYKLDDGNLITETFTGTVTPFFDVDFTFNSTIDMSTEGQTYNLSAFTDLETDLDRGNDTSVQLITHLYARDIGVSDIIQPQSSSNLEQEEVVVEISNYGGLDQSNFMVSYAIDGQEAANEQVTDTVFAGGVLTYAFEQTADLSNVGTYSFASYTNLENDALLINDTTYKTVVHDFCTPFADCSSGDGIYELILGSIENISGCGSNGYQDFSSLVANLERNETHALILTTNYGDQFIKAWIDFNDNGVFELEEVVVDDYEMADGQGEGVYTDTLYFNIPAEVDLGPRLMRVKTNWDGPVPDNACEGTEYGETEDYTVNIELFTGTSELWEGQNDLQILYLPNNTFKLLYTNEEVNEPLIFNVYDMNGRIMIQYRLFKEGTSYQLGFDMSYAEPGMYLVRIGNDQFGRVEKIIVQ